MLRRQRVDRRRAAARVDRAAHHRHRERRVSPRLAISEIAASTGTVGWHTEITQVARADVADELLDVRDVVVQMERPTSTGTMRASTSR
jgi:hypothetical protein